VYDTKALMSQTRNRVNRYHHRKYTLSLPSDSKTSSWWSLHLRKHIHTAPYPSIDPRQPKLTARGRSVLVTGSGNGIGRAIARKFAEAGASNIILFGRTEPSLLETKDIIEKEHPKSKVTYFTLDVTDEDGVNRAFSVIHTDIGAVDVLVSNAGYLPDLGPVRESSLNDWWRGMEVNVRGPLILIKAFLELAAPNAALLNISSSVAHVSYYPGYSSYASSKLAAAKAFEYIQKENPSIRVISFHPGVVMTEMQEKSTKALGMAPSFDDSKSLSNSSFVLC
jgi:NAD(P)-dependent dehydrogenase (short-subunit alcohol dehydrogenase family)